MKIKWILIVQLILLVIGIVMGTADGITMSSKLTISSLFVVTAVYYFMKDKFVYNKFFLPAMIFCFLGDFATSDLLPGGLTTAMLLFGVGHVFFIPGFLKTAKFFKTDFPKITYAFSALIYYGLFMIVWLLFVIPAERGMLFTVAGLIYGIITSTMASMAVSLAKANKVYIMAAIGGAFFWLSDTLIAVELKVSFTGIGHLIIITYFIAIGLILHNSSLKGAKSI